MWTNIAWGLLPFAPVIIFGVVALFYSRIWGALTQEPFTNIMRRKALLSIPVAVVALAFLGTVVWAIGWQWDDGWMLAWAPTLTVGLWALWAHVDWAGIRWGAIHRPTAWRCAEELRSFSVPAAEWLETQLNNKGFLYEPSDRSDDRRGLPGS